jgi:hypothetical protein
MHQMDIKGEEMYERLLSLADESYHPVKSLIDGLDPLMCKVTLIEVCRSLDYWHVMDHFSGKNPNPLSIPEFNIIRRGWNPLFALLLPRVGGGIGVPLMESTNETSNRAMTLLYNMGKYAILRDSADMVRHGMLVGEEFNGEIVLRMSSRVSLDHYLDRLEGQKLENIQNEMRCEDPLNALFDSKAVEGVKDAMAGLVFPWHTGKGTMIGYGAEPEVDDYFLALVSKNTLEWRNEAGIHPDSSVNNVPGSVLTSIVLLIISLHLKHIHFVGIGTKKIQEANYRMSITIWKQKNDFVKSISDYTGIDENLILSVMDLVTVKPHQKDYFANVLTPFVPLFIELSDNYLLSPISSIFQNPFGGIRMLHAKHSSHGDVSIQSFREEWMRSDLYHLFLGNRYDRIEGAARLKRSKKVVTDIDAAVFDKTTGELALFQLKWQDFLCNNVGSQCSKAKNFVQQVDAWAEKTHKWIEEFGVIALCRSLRLRLVGNTKINSIKLFAIGRSNARFRSYGYVANNELVSACTWKQFLRIRYEVGPEEIVIGQLHNRVMAEQYESVEISPLCHEIYIGDQKIVFKDLWNVCAGST